MNSMLGLSLVELSEKFKERKLSPVEIVNICLERIEKTEDRLNAYVRTLPESARIAAAQAEAEITRGNWRGQLHGVPVAVKDLYDMAEVPTTASSRQRTNWMPRVDSTVVAKLKAAGAIIVGKTHTHEFAYGVTTPTTHNPWDLDRTPGGSSGGSGATVASSGVFMATGTDTGGSIRIPASVCGTVGLKPTYGRVSRAGITSLSWGLDHAGPLTRTVEDAAVSLQVMAGYDPSDPGSLDEPVPDFRADLKRGVRQLRIGVPTNYFFDHLNPEVERAVRMAYKTLESLGANLVEVRLPLAEQIMPVYFAIMLPEASAYHRKMLRNTPELYGKDVRAFLEMGEMMFATDYIQAQRVRRLIQCEIRDLYENVDVIVAPTLTTVAVSADAESVAWSDETKESVLSAYVRFTVPADVTGLPSLSVPCGFSEQGLPIGLQIIGRPLDERTVLRVGAAYESATEWHKKHPDI